MDDPGKKSGPTGIAAVVEKLEGIQAKILAECGPESAQMKEFMDRVDRLEKSVMARKVSLAGLEDEKQKFSWGKALYAISNKDFTGAEFEKEIFDQARKKAQNSESGAAGGFLVPEEVATGVIEKLEPKAVVMQMGATVLPGLTGGQLAFPRQNGSATANWRGENVAITESEITLDDLVLRPKSIAALVKMSNEVLRRSNPAIDGLIENDIVKQVAKAIDLAALRGSGTEYQPLGIANTPGISSLPLDTNGKIFDYDDAVDMEALLEDDDALEGELGYVFHPRVKNLMRKIRIPQFSGQTDGEYVLPPIMSNAKLAETLGVQFQTTTQIPTNLAKGSSTALSEVYFGNWNELLIGQWGGMEIKASEETSDAFEKNQTWIRIIQEVDMGLRHVESFALVNDAATTNPVA